MSNKCNQPQHTFRLWALALACVVVVFGAGYVGYSLSLASGKAEIAAQSNRRLQLFDRTLEANIERFHYLPSTISQSADVRDALANPQDDLKRSIANGFLSKLSGAAVADELYVMDMNGRTVAASNWWSQVSFVGESYHARPYFLEAVSNGAAQYYAVGQTSQIAGYFLAERIDGPNGPVGVSVVKINLGEIEALWWRSGELIGIVDANDVVILSTRPDWRYRQLVSVSPADYSRISSDPMYGGNKISVVGVVSELNVDDAVLSATINSGDGDLDGNYIIEQLRLPAHAWRILSFTNMTPLQNAAWTQAAAVSLATAALLLGAALLFQRQKLFQARLQDQQKLEERVEQRTSDLQVANSRLETEIQERRRAERERRGAQEGLVQAAKLASLGQALAGVAHEISQPVAALTLQLSSAQILSHRRENAGVIDVLTSMDSVLSRLASLTGHLKTFARKETDISIISDVAQIVPNALDLTAYRIKSLGIAVTFHPPAATLYVLGNPIHLEQVLLNLISNACDAMEIMPLRELRISILPSGDKVVIEVTDSGEGIKDDVLPFVFDPFMTTKEPGRGLGLGLSISYGLMRDMSGAITVSSIKGAGSTFTLTLPLTNERMSTSTGRLE